MNDVLFVLFSIIEAASIFSVSLILFRYHPFHYMSPILSSSVVMSLLSLFLWKDDGTLNYAQVITFIMFYIFIHFYLKVSILGSANVTLFGFAAYAFNQTAILKILQWFDLFSFGNEFEGFALQLISSLVLFLICWLLYRKGYGFTYSLDKFKNKWENIFVVFLLMVSVVLVAFIQSMRENVFEATVYLSYSWSLYSTSHYEVKQSMIEGLAKKIAHNIKATVPDHPFLEPKSD